MRHLGNLPSQNQAETLVAWLIAERIDVHVDHHGQQWELWVKDEDQLPAARQAFQEFLTDPDHARYANARQRATAIIREKQEKQKQYYRNYVDISRTPSARMHAPLTWTLIAISAVVALATSFGHDEQLAQAPFTSLALMAVPFPQADELLKAHAGDTAALGVKFANILAGELWRIVTPIFLHFGTMHLIFNMIILYQLGMRVESLYGAFRFGILVFVIAVISNGVQAAVPVAWGGLSAGVLSDYLLVGLGGMSGVGYGLFGFVWVKSTLEPHVGFHLPQSTVVIMLGWLFFCMSPWSQEYLGFAVANWAHGIGLLVGMAIAYLPATLRRLRR